VNTTLLHTPQQAVLESAAEEYLETCLATLTKASADKNRYTVGKFVAWLRAQGVEEPSGITTRLYMAYLRHLATTVSPKTGKLRARGTVRDGAVVLKTFLKWCYRHRYIDAERLYGYEIPKAKNPAVTVATHDQLCTVIRLVDEYWDINLHPKIKFWPARSHKFFQRRMKLILAIAMSTGMRIGETLNMRLSSYDPAAKLIYVTETKTGKNRDVPVGPDVAKAFSDYLKVRPKGAPTDFVIVTETGTQLGTRACTRQYQRYLAFGRSRGIDLPRLTMHSWRHVALNAMAKVNTEHARRMAGHSSLTTTLRYLHTTSADVRASHDKADPLAGILVNTLSKNQGTDALKPRARKLF